MNVKLNILNTLKMRLRIPRKSRRLVFWLWSDDLLVGMPPRYDRTDVVCTHQTLIGRSEDRGLAHVSGVAIGDILCMLACADVCSRLYSPFSLSR